MQLLFILLSCILEVNVGRETLPTQPTAYLGHTHLVGGECASLIGADDRGAAQGLHGGQASDNGVLLGHTAGAQGKAGGDDSGQTCSSMRSVMLG